MELANPAEADEHRLKEIERVLRAHVKSKSLTDEAFLYMALIVCEDSPKNAAELAALIGDFLTDGMAYSEEEAFRQCETIVGLLLAQQLLKVDLRDTIVAEKLHNPVVISEIRQAGHSGVIREEEFSDPFVDSEKRDGNFNSFDGMPWDSSKRKKKAAAEEQRVQDALDQKIEEFVQHKRKIPAPTVVHDKPDPFRNDIIISNLTLIIGGKTLLEDAQFKLVQGRKYGLVGRNGIGKTTLINALTRKDIDKFP